jgi:hypothetical protein
VKRPLDEDKRPSDKHIEDQKWKGKRERLRVKKAEWENEMK